jgi:hypothetical protein
MLNKDSFKILKLPVLKLFCKNAKIKINQNKQSLFDCYNRYLAVKIIQRCYRKHFYRNADCSITLEKVNYPCFVYRSKYGKLFFYDLVSIVKYICKTGNTHDPMTREQYSDTTLNNLDNLVKQKCEKRYSSTLKIKRNVSYARTVRDQENDIITYQTLLEENRNLVINLIESGIFNLTGSVYINGENFDGIGEYLVYLLEKINVIYNTLKALDPFWAGVFKTEFLEILGTYTENDVKNIIEFINLI